TRFAVSSFADACSWSALPVMVVVLLAIKFRRDDRRWRGGTTSALAPTSAGVAESTRSPRSIVCCCERAAPRLDASLRSRRDAAAPDTYFDRVGNRVCG